MGSTGFQTNLVPNIHEIVILKKRPLISLSVWSICLMNRLQIACAIPFYFVSQLAHDSGLKVVQVGEGADEHFFWISIGMRNMQTLYQQIWKPSVSIYPGICQTRCRVSCPTNNNITSSQGRNLSIGC
jgi:asparagine synthase (glutamine-hydrolysing)